MYNPIIAHRYSTDISILRTQRASGIVTFPAKNVAADCMGLARARGGGGSYHMTQNSCAHTHAHRSKVNFPSLLYIQTGTVFMKPGSET